MNEEYLSCPYGCENCDENDWESMCNECKQDRAERYFEAMSDTFD